MSGGRRASQLSVKVVSCSSQSTLTDSRRPVLVAVTVVSGARLRVPPVVMCHFGRHV